MAGVKGMKWGVRKQRTKVQRANKIVKNLAMRKTRTRIGLKNTDGKNIGEYIISDGNNHKLYSPYGNRSISLGQFKAILRQHT